MTTALVIFATLWIVGWLATAWETRGDGFLKLIAIWPLALWEMAAFDR
jgi:hypothetical protein